MSDDRNKYRTINVDEQLYADLKRMKGDHYTWTGLLRKMWLEVDGANYAKATEDDFK